MFEAHEYLMEPNEFSITEDQNPLLIREIIGYIDKVKTVEKETPIINIIMDYAFKNDIDVDTIGDIISTDVYFKSFIEKDCEYHRIFKSEINEIDNW